MRARSMLFTLFGDYIRHYGGSVWVGSLIALMAELGFTAQAVRAAVSRMARQGWLVPIRAGRASYYALSLRGQDRIEEAAQRIFKLHPEHWDGLWRILIVPTQAPSTWQGHERTRRTELRRELGWMGFAALSRGVYISPNDLLDRIAALAERYGLAGEIEMFTAEHNGPSPSPALAARYWDLDALGAAYARFVADWKPRLEERRKSASGGDEATDRAGVDQRVSFAEKTLLVHAFRKFLFVDPGLPQELLPAGWSGLEARAVFSAYYHLLTEGALRFFEQHYRPAPGREGDLSEGRRAARRDPFRPMLPTR